MAPPPPFGANSAAARDVANVLHPYTDLKTHLEVGPMVVTRGQGVRIWDDTGKEYIEGMAGLWCAALGFDNERLIQATRVLSTTERLAYGTLVKALPEYLILAQVPLSRFLSVPKRNSYADWLRRVGYQCVDFVVCDMAAQVVAVVELQGTQSSERSRKRLARMSRSLKAADIPMQIWRENSLPSSDAAR